MRRPPSRAGTTGWPRSSGRRAARPPWSGTRWAGGSRAGWSRPGGRAARAVAGWADGLAAVERRTRGAAAVVGYSLGARIALGLVATRRAPAAVLIGVNPGLADEDRPARAAADAAWAALLRARGID